MTEQTPLASKPNRGRKPLGDAAMTPAERQRRRRELLRAVGDKHYLLRLNGLHQECVEMLAKVDGVSGTAALQGIVQVSLDRFAGVMHRCERLRELGASDDDIEAFIHTHLSPSLPPIDELELPRPDTNRRIDDKTGVSSSR